MTQRTQQTKRFAFALLLGTSLISTSTLTTQAEDSPKEGTAPAVNHVRANKPDEPRATPVTREAMKQFIEDLKQRTPRIPLPELTDEEKKRAAEDPRTTQYETRLRTLYLVDSPTNGYMGFGGSPANANSNPNRNNNNNTPDPKLSLGYPFKVRLFWIAARGNNCQYCLGHQESKLLAAGMNEDEIASLDSNWESFPAEEQAAFALAKRLTTEPHLLTDADIDACRKHYNDLQILEMIGSVAGNNAINRWKEGAGIPQSRNGGSFGPSTSTNRAIPPHDDSHSYLTPTSSKFANASSKVIKLDSKVSNIVNAANATTPTLCIRPALETGAELNAKLASVETRKPRLPLTDEATAREAFGEFLDANKPVPAWARLLANFPIAGKRYVSGIVSSQQSDKLSRKLQLEIDWVVARQDRAWYAAALAKDGLKELNVTDDELQALDGDISVENDKSPLSKNDRALLTLAKNLAASPIVLTDHQVSQAVEAVGPRAVVQAIHYTTYRAAFDRITEAAGLAK